MSINNFNNRYKIGYRNGVWYLIDELTETYVITNDKNIINAYFIKEGGTPPYQLLSHLISNPSSDREWEYLKSNYPLI